MSRGHPDGRPGRVLPLPLARGRSGHVALPLPRRGSHDARDDRHLPGLAVRAQAALPGRRRRGSRVLVPSERRRGAAAGGEHPVRGLRPVAARRAAGRDGASGRTSASGHTRSPPIPGSSTPATSPAEPTSPSGSTPSGPTSYHCTIHPSIVGEIDVRRVILEPLPTGGRAGRHAGRVQRPYRRPVPAGARPARRTAPRSRRSRPSRPPTTAAGRPRSSAEEPGDYRATSGTTSARPAGCSSASGRSP